MSKWIEYATVGFFAVIGLAIIFVKAGSKNNGNASGGTQTAQIISAGGGALAQMASALEGN